MKNRGVVGRINRKHERVSAFSAVGHGTGLPGAYTLEFGLSFNPSPRDTSRATKFHSSPLSLNPQTFSSPSPTPLPGLPESLPPALSAPSERVAIAKRDCGPTRRPGDETLEGDFTDAQRPRARYRCIGTVHLRNIISDVNSGGA